MSAPFIRLQVSTTHAVVGAVMGVGITSFGAMVVIWDRPNHVITQGGFSAIVASWFISPALSGALAATFYLTTKALVFFVFYLLYS
jgi:phosphate/sulfate permease